MTSKAENDLLQHMTNLQDLFKKSKVDGEMALNIFTNLIAHLDFEHMKAKKYDIPILLNALIELSATQIQGVITQIQEYEKGLIDVVKKDDGTVNIVTKENFDISLKEIMESDDG